MEDGVSFAEIEAERAKLLRRRTIWCAGVFLVLAMMALAGELADPTVVDLQIDSDRPRLVDFARIAVSGVTEAAGMLAVFTSALLFALFARPTTSRALGAVYWMVVGAQALVIMRHLSVAVFAPTENTIALLVQESALAMLLLFFIACIIMPWSPREAVRPLIPCVVMHQAVLLALGRWELIAQASGLVLIVAAAIPGLGLTMLRWRPEEDIASLRVRSRRYGSLARDLFDARRIHESIFPAAITDGPVHITYRYHPSQQIGGDFLYARRIGDDLDAPIAVVVVDVTGHGVASALTVNRLHAEIERTLRERPDTSPGAMLSRLNDYLHFTLAIHSVYATAVCLRIESPNADGVCRLRWASGGHPPALLRHADGSIERLWSTAFMLGVVSGSDYTSDEREHALAPGELLLLYTDGATDMPTTDGGMLEIAGVESLFLKALGDAESIAASLDRATTAMRSGRATDDTLFVVINRTSSYRPSPNIGAAT